MLKRRGKSVSFDAMVKFFMQTYHIPTKRDVERILEKISQLEAIIKNASEKNFRMAVKSRPVREKRTMTASDQVLDIIRRHKEGASFADIQNRSGFDEKKLRNIIFRLNKLKRINRKTRGRYISQ